MAEQWEHGDQEEVRSERLQDGGRVGHAGPLNQGEDFGFLLSWVPVENTEQRKNIIRHMSSYDPSGCYMQTNGM